ncbi:glutamate synthase large subunit [Reyranella sp.]|uniref:glutamate synthase large subunit n=1 Tax=Reyranella sp. TaxID=1929291 RepID=UPI002F92C64A
MSTQSFTARQFVRAYREGVARLTDAYGYNPAQEIDSCGVGLVVALDGKRRRDVVAAGIDALKAVWHRGAVDADGKTGDGAGIHVEIPQDFFRDYIRDASGHEPQVGRIAVGTVFLPRTDLGAQERCRTIVETEILRFGHMILGWRQVPVDISVIGEKANETRPEIEQILIGRGDPKLDNREFEKQLYILRRRMEKAAIAENIAEFYVCSLSCRSLIYKGMFLAEHLSQFYPDLLDERFVSRFAIFHQRYSTNTFPQWKLAQPFRVLAHNGEINTLLGNVNWMKSHEARLAHDGFGRFIEDLKPIIQPSASDSAALDNVFELLVRGHRNLPMVKAMMIPEALGSNPNIPAHHRALYHYVNGIMEPWDGPAAIAAVAGKWALVGLDRNGLRPMRYVLTSDQLLIAGSEAGMVPQDEAKIVEKGRLGPGEMLAVDMDQPRLYKDRELKDMLAATNDYADWVKRTIELDSLIRQDTPHEQRFGGEELRRRQFAVGWSIEDLEMILHPMVEDGKEPVGSMGDDAPMAVLSDTYRGMHHYFRQNFSQVTNPPIDSLRERQVMTIRTRLGNLGNVLDESPEQSEMLSLQSPIVLNAEFEAMRKYMGDTAARIDCSYDPKGGLDAMRQAFERICKEAEDAVRSGCLHVVLTDANVDGNRAALPMILAAGCVHSYLVRQSLRTFTSLNVRSGECLDVHYAAVIIGVGATTVNPYLAEETIAARHARGLFGKLSLGQCLANYKKALDDGLLKVMSKMGISVLSSYRGGCNFEAVGLSRSLVQEFFPGMPSRISGIGLRGVQEKISRQHARAFDEEVIALPIGGFYKYRRGGDHHNFEGNLIHVLQDAVATESYAKYRKYSEAVRRLPPINLRDLLDFKADRRPVPIDEVESITELRKRLVAPGISLGALSPEAHETLSIAMNRIGAKSDSGEGGEDPARYRPRPNGDNASSAIKQVASGRFGVTAEYLNNCRELEIKIAQGAKPGEGGQLPGLKVSEMIARLRHSTPGVSLISPPPHHDIYSIEDLAQLIYDLKQINPEARVTVKLVARSGIGTIAAGVAKAKADVILVSGHSGGTGASPQSSIKYAGIPWEMGLSETHQVLTLNRLREKVLLRTDGGIKTGRDVVIAALLGAEEYGIGTASLVAMGCIMVRQCHSNTCPVGVCTQDPKLRAKFGGSPEKVVNLFSFVAEEVREILAQLGYRSLSEIVGRSDLLKQVSRGARYLDDLDLSPLLTRADGGRGAVHCTVEGRNEVPDTLDARMIRDAQPLFTHREKMQLQYSVRNTHRAVGTRLAALITRKYGMSGLQSDTVTVRLRGTAGQSLGAFAVQGMKLEVFGDANDYVGKGLSGGTIVVRPTVSSPLVPEANAIIGNTVLYGATAGKLFASGRAGERFAVRNSGADTVVEGVGCNGCEYMTGGTAVVLGSVGVNFAAGMTGGMAFVYDPEDAFMLKVNPETVVWQRIDHPHWDAVLKAMVAEHVAQTKSPLGARLLNDWNREVERFWQIVPKEMLSRLPEPLTVMKEKTA